MSPKLKAAMQLASVVSTAFGMRSRIREARENNDRLALADTIIAALGVVTGTALALRTLRKGDEK